MNKVLFAVNGFGMGNATRCDALADLLPSNTRIDFITSDKALKYFQAAGKTGNVYRQKDINSGKADNFGSPAFFLKYIPRFLNRIVANFRIQRKLMAENKYDMVVFDSDYSFILHRIFGTSAVLVGLNNSYEVLNYFFRNPLSLRLNLLPSLIVELLDFSVHSVFCRYVLCPSIQPEALRGLFGKFLISPLLVRQKLMTYPRPEKTSGVMVMASSSRAKSSISQLATLDFTTDNIRQLVESSAIVCNAGQSSISECLYLNKPATFVPIPKHAEQFANANLARNHNSYNYASNAAAVKKLLHNIEESNA
jgi:hypothetical protein